MRGVKVVHEVDREEVDKRENKRMGRKGKIEGEEEVKKVWKEKKYYNYENKVLGKPKRKE